MSRLNARSPLSQWWLVLWWAGWLAALLGSRAPGVDYAGLEAVPVVADAMVIVGGSAALVGLTVLVRGISLRHVAPTPEWDAPLTADGAPIDPLDLLKRRE